jgi:chemotaxis methyl-accepting protein methylase
MAEEQQEPTAEAIKQRKKREKEAAKNAALGIEKFTVEVAGVFKPDLKKVMKAHGINNQQEVYQLLLMNLIAADFEIQAKMLRCVTTPFIIDEKVSKVFRNKSLRLLHDSPGEPEDKIFEPEKSA